MSPRHVLEDTPSLTISRSKEAPSPTWLCMSINRAAASSDAHIDVARRPGDGPRSVASHRWYQGIMISTTTGTTFSLQSIHLGPAPSVAVGNNERQWHVKKQNLSRCKGTARRPSCRSEGSTSTCCHQLRDATMKVTDVEVELRHIYLPGCRSYHPTTHHSK
jgi:hypothetical protein